jgi:hypothetical protein
MTYDPIDTNETDNNADGKLTIDDLTATTVAGLDTSSGTGNEQIFTDGEGGLLASGYPLGLPVAFQNLIAWYPFDSATYGGNNADDVTGGEAYYGDSTAFDGTVNGATYQSSGGVTDISAGANSGSFDVGPNEHIDLGPIPSIGDNNAFSICFWFKSNNTSQGSKYFVSNWSSGGFFFTFRGFDIIVRAFSGGTSTSDVSIPFDFDGQTTFTHAVLTVIEGVEANLYIDGTFVAGDSLGGSFHSLDDDVYLGRKDDSSTEDTDYDMDDVRFYNKELSDSEINRIYLNTEP